MTSLKIFENGFNGPWEFYSKLFVEGNGKFVYGEMSPKTLSLHAFLVLVCGAAMAQW